MDDHDHSHHQDAPSLGLPRNRSAKRRPLAVALGITSAFLIVEIIGGIVTHSLALLADAGHMATDAGALVLALFAVWLASRPATAHRSFGFLRAEILAAALNAAVLLLLSLFIFYEAWQRFAHPPAVRSGLMLGVAIAGFCANLASAWVLSRGGSHKHDLNTRGAFLHVVGDLLGSVATILAALIIMVTGWNRADPILSVIIGGSIVFSAWRLLRESVDILLEATPAGIDPVAVRTTLKSVPGVAEVHDLHIWTVTSGVIAASAHLEITNVPRTDDLLADATQRLSREFGIAHTTLQLERYDPDRIRTMDCSLDSEEGLAVCQNTVVQRQERDNDGAAGG